MLGQVCPPYESKSEDVAKRSGSLGVILILVLGSLSTPSLAREGSSSPPTLGYRNVITGDAISGITVRVPERAIFTSKVSRSPSFDISGQGRVLGFALVRQAEDVEDTWAIYGTRWSFCAMRCTEKQLDERLRGTKPDELSGGYGWRSDEGPPRYVVDPGVYRLYLIADGHPVRVTLTLNGLQGTRHLVPTDEVAGRILDHRNFDSLERIGGGYLGRSEESLSVPSNALYLNGIFDYWPEDSGGVTGDYILTMRDSNELPPEDDGPGGISCCGFSTPGPGPWVAWRSYTTSYIRPDEWTSRFAAHAAWDKEKPPPEAMVFVLPYQ